MANNDLNFFMDDPDYNPERQFGVSNENVVDFRSEPLVPVINPNKPETPAAGAGTGYMSQIEKQANGRAWDWTTHDVTQGPITDVRDQFQRDGDALGAGQAIVQANDYEKLSGSANAINDVLSDREKVRNQALWDHPAVQDALKEKGQGYAIQVVTALKREQERYDYVASKRADADVPDPTSIETIKTNLANGAVGIASATAPVADGKLGAFMPDIKAQTEGLPDDIRGRVINTLANQIKNAQSVMTPFADMLKKPPSQTTNLYIAAKKASLLATLNGAPVGGNKPGADSMVYQYNPNDPAVKSLTEDLSKSYTTDARVLEIGQKGQAFDLAKQRQTARAKLSEDWARVYNATQDVITKALKEAREEQKFNEMSRRTDIAEKNAENQFKVGNLRQEVAQVRDEAQKSKERFDNTPNLSNASDMINSGRQVNKSQLDDIRRKSMAYIPATERDNATKFFDGLKASNDSLSDNPTDGTYISIAKKRLAALERSSGSLSVVLSEDEMNMADYSPEKLQAAIKDMPQGSPTREYWEYQLNEKVASEARDMAGKIDKLREGHIKTVLDGVADSLNDAPITYETYAPYIASKDGIVTKPDAVKIVVNQIIDQVSKEKGWDRDMSNYLKYDMLDDKRSLSLVDKRASDIVIASINGQWDRKLNKDQHSRVMSEAAISSPVNRKLLEDAGAIINGENGVNANRTTVMADDGKPVTFFFPPIGKIKEHIESADGKVLSLLANQDGVTSIESGRAFIVSPQGAKNILAIVNPNPQLKYGAATPVSAEAKKSLLSRGQGANIINGVTTDQENYQRVKPDIDAATLTMQTPSKGTTEDVRLSKLIAKEASAGKAWARFVSGDSPDARAVHKMIEGGDIAEGITLADQMQYRKLEAPIRTNALAAIRQAGRAFKFAIDKVYPDARAMSAKEAQTWEQDISPAIITAIGERTDRMNSQEIGALKMVIDDTRKFTQEARSMYKKFQGSQLTPNGDTVAAIKRLDRIDKTMSKLKAVIGMPDVEPASQWENKMMDAAMLAYTNTGE